MTLAALRLVRCLWLGPCQALDIRVADPEAGEGATRLVPIAFVTGRTVELPEDHPLVATFDAAGFLGPAPEAPIAAEPEAPVAGELVSAEAPIETSAAEPDPAPTPARPRGRAADTVQE